MVFKPFTHLARQSFVKTFTHGYAQSVVAASQSSYAASTTSLGPFGNHTASRFGKPGTAQLQNAFQNSSNSSGAAGGPKTGQPHSGGNTDGGVAAYLAAWQQQQNNHEEDREWKQLQFAKRIAQKGDADVKEGEGKGKKKDVSPGATEDAQLERGTLGRTRSASAVDDLKRDAENASEIVASATVDAEIAEEISRVKEASVASAQASNAVSEVTESQAEVYSVEVDGTSAGTTHSPAPPSEASKFDESPATSSTTATSVSGSPSEAYTEQIAKLRDAHRFAEIPAVFEASLAAGVHPTVASYNALLDAAIQLPTNKHQAVPKALNVYADMLRRKVLPDTSTYSTLIELLALRSLDVSAMQHELEEKRVRFGGVGEAGRFMFQSTGAELEILQEDDSLSIAIKLFNASTFVRKERAFPAETYHVLIAACAEQGLTNDMIRIYAHMESRKVQPFAATFPPMIDAFAAARDLSSAVECYDEYKALAVADNSGQPAILDRIDDHVYAAVTKAYVTCGKPEGAIRFYEKVQGILGGQREALEVLHDVVVPQAFIQNCIKNGSFDEALQWVEKSALSDAVRTSSLAQICTAAADSNQTAVSNMVFKIMPAVDVTTITAMLALSIRRGDVNSARDFWGMLDGTADATPSLVEPTAMYAVALIGSGSVDEGISQARLMFDRIRTASVDRKDRLEASEGIDESIEYITNFLAAKGVVPSAQASMDILWTMVENGGLLVPVVRQVFAGLGPNSISQLSYDNLVLSLQIQAGIIVRGSEIPDVADTARFAQMFEILLTSASPLDQRTRSLIDQGLARIGKSDLPHGRPDLLHQWQSYLQPRTEQVYAPVHYAPRSYVASVTPSMSYDESFDPHGAKTDYKGSAIISEELDKMSGRSGNGHLQECLSRFRNMRRAGRHPRYITYAKLITAAAKEDRINLAHDILAMARTDVPFLPQYRVTRYGWVSILDAMVGTCLNLGKRDLAAQYHQELLDMGAAPTANTFGLYITTLKESTKSSDEATEAVKIFHRAKSEGVEPSSFLYNALIGKLGKARRIDDCLFYFAEMRELGIRPTSVSYGTIVNALCRVSDEKFAEELFDEMESMPNYKPRPAPYNSLMQFFLTTKRDKTKVLAYYERMKATNITPTMHTYKLLIDTYATLDPIDMPAAEALLQTMRQSGQKPEAVHFASLVHAKGCVLHDMDGARKVFDDVVADKTFRPQACLYQALFEAMVANHRVVDTDSVLRDMKSRHIEMTPYIANTLIHGWAMEKELARSESIYNSISATKREPSTYEAMCRAYLSVEDKHGAMGVVQEMLSKGYPAAVSGKILELVGGGAPLLEE
ncbi:MAG: hypothetical protein M1837_003102 [Sclerophora amabilis]|nr:MAG: hypothetical protein M1837_003102 [Sclerophora amabilis]